MSSTAGVKPTKGFLMDMKRRIGFIERGTEFLKLKRDQLAKELTTSLDVLRGRRRVLMDNLQEAYHLKRVQHQGSVPHRVVDIFFLRLYA